MHLQGLISRETEIRTTYFCCEAFSEQSKDDEPQLISMFIYNFILTVLLLKQIRGGLELGCSLNRGANKKGALINKNQL